MHMPLITLNGVIWLQRNYFNDEITSQFMVIGSPS